MRTLTVVLPVLMMAAIPAAAQTNYDTVQVHTLPITGNVFMLLGAGGNIAVSVGDDGVFMVDGQLAQLTRRIQAAIAELTPGRLRYVVNSHWHPDHTGGNQNLGGAGATLLAHENVRRRMSSAQFIEAQNRTIPASPRGALPTAVRDTTFQFNGESIVVTHVPRAHTDGDVIVHFATSNVFHMGDVFNNTGAPFVDLSSGGSVQGLIAAVDKVLALSDDQTRIIPGHGDPANKARLRAYRDMVDALVVRIRTLIAAGRTADQILELDIGAPYAKEFPAGHARFVRETYSELLRQRGR